MSSLLTTTRRCWCRWSRLVLLVVPLLFMLHNGAITITNATQLDASATSPIAAAAAGIENDVLHFSYELERTWLDGDKRPCQNFYDFVCSRSSFNSSEAQLLAQRQRQAQEQKFEKFLANENDEQLMDSELKLKLFYMSCKEARSMDDLKSTLMYRNSGGWPAIDDSATMIRKRRNITWLGVLSAFHDAGFEYFFETFVEIKSNKRILHLAPQSANMRYTMRKFEQLVSDFLDESTIPMGRARLVALETMSFERNRREIAKEEEAGGLQPQELTYEAFKNEFLETATHAEWDAYFRRTLGKVLKSNDTIHVLGKTKLKKFFELLQRTTMTRLLNWIWIDYLIDKNASECQTLTRNYFENVYQHIVERASLNKVQMAQMYTEIAQSYEALLPPSVWIDEMSQQRSKQFHGRVMHLTLNGDSQLDANYADLTITRRNFYRNLEKMQSHLLQQRKRKQQQSETTQTQSQTQSYEISQAASEFMKVFLTIGGGGGGVLQQQNLTMPLNYVLVGEHFAEMMIASGGSSKTPGAWRSMDSEHEFATFKQCLSRQKSEDADDAAAVDNTFNRRYNASTLTTSYNSNDLLLRILAQHQTLNALNSWQAKNLALWKRLDRLLTAGRLQLTLRKLYFVGALLTNCQQATDGQQTEVQRQFVNSYLRNSQEFTQTFGCRAGDRHYARNICKVF